MINGRARLVHSQPRSKVLALSLGIVSTKAKEFIPDACDGRVDTRHSSSGGILSKLSVTMTRKKPLTDCSIPLLKTLCRW